MKEDWGDTTAWPNEDGHFDLTPFHNNTCFLVMGEDVQAKNDLDKRAALSYTYSPQPSTSGITAKRPLTMSKKGKNGAASGGQTMPIKIVVAEMKKTSKGVTFQESTQTYISVNDQTANVLYIKDCIKNKLQKDVTLVSGNGLELEEEEGTRGIYFV